MSGTRQRHSLKACLGVRVESSTRMLAIVFVLAIAASPVMQAQTFQVLHTFAGGLDGGFPFDLTTDAAGNLYGPASCCGLDYGGVYELQRSGSDWLFNPLYLFDGNDGTYPQNGVAFGPDGLLYGTTTNGGTDGNGVVFSLRPAAGFCRGFFCPRTETVLYNFGYSPDAAGPTGDLTFDQAGNIYGVAGNGPEGGGAVYELMPSGNSWIERVLYGFPQTDGEQAHPYSGVIFDNAGNLYGTTVSGGAHNKGTVFQLVPGNGGWTENTLYNFQGGSDGDYPYGGLIFDRAGNIYGTTFGGGDGGGGTVFVMTPSNGGWTFTTIYSFVATSVCQGGADRGGPLASLVMDAAGSLYASTVCDGAYGLGSAFKLTRSGGTWAYSDLHDFCAEGRDSCSDGYFPSGRLALDAAGNIYGTSWSGGHHYLAEGVAWEITP
jgi:uncharacterized repeat protein (TIGR03803 family)